MLKFLQLVDSALLDFGVFSQCLNLAFVLFLYCSQSVIFDSVKASVDLTTASLAPLLGLLSNIRLVDLFFTGVSLFLSTILLLFFLELMQSLLDLLIFAFDRFILSLVVFRFSCQVLGLFLDNFLKQFFDLLYLFG